MYVVYVVDENDLLPQGGTNTLSLCLSLSASALATSSAEQRETSEREGVCRLDSRLDTACISRLLIDCSRTRRPPRITRMTAAGDVYTTK